MPTYAYACADCGHAFDIVQSFSDDSLTVCPECEGRLRKQFNAVGVVFKGSGFYRNDSRSSTSSTSPPAPGSKGTKGSDAGGSGDASGGGAATSASAPAASAPAASSTGTTSKSAVSTGSAP